MSNNYRNTLVNLGVIGKLEKMDKLNTFYQIFYREKPGILQSFQRWLRDDNQMKTSSAIEDLVNGAITAIENNVYDKTRTLKLYKYLLESENGIVNLRETYKNNDSTDEQLTIIIDTLRELPLTFPTLHREYLSKYIQVINEEEDEIVECTEQNGSTN